MMAGSASANRRPILRFYPEEWGYGPLGNALHIARAVRSLASDAVSVEIVLSKTFRGPVDSGLFDRVHDDIGSAEKADAVITVMNVKGVMKAAKRGERVYAVDALAWLWDEPLPIEDLIHTYFYQDLPVLPVPERNFIRMPNATPISAIGRLPEPAAGCEPTASHGPKLVISLSGLETPDARLGMKSLWYPAYILDALEHLAQSRLIDPDDMTIFGNAAVIQRFAGSHIARAVRQKSSQQDFSAAAHAAGAVVCSPGLTTIVECLRAGIGIKLLPAQNFGQVRQMRAFADSVGIPAMSWSGVAVEWLQNATLPGEVRRAIMRGIIAEERLSRDHADPEALLSLLTREVDAPDPETVARWIGPDDGAITVARRVVSDLLG